jgi:hypothetical protein
LERAVLCRDVINKLRAGKSMLVLPFHVHLAYARPSADQPSPQ